MKPDCKTGRCVSQKDKEIMTFIFESEYQQMKAKALKALIEESSY